MSTEINGIAGLKALEGQHLGYSDYLEITQERVNQFAEATGDHQWIHVDPEKAKDGPFAVVVRETARDKAQRARLWLRAVAQDGLPAVGDLPRQ